MKSSKNEFLYVRLLKNIYMKSSKRRRPTSWCTGGHGARQERSQFCFHSQPSALCCLLPSSQPSASLSLPFSQQTSSVSCLLLHQSQPSSVSSCLSPTSPPPPYPCLDPFFLINLQLPRHHHLRLK